MTSSETLQADIEHYRKKLQRTTIEDVGVHGVQLWSAAIRLMVLTRTIVPPRALPSPAPVPPTPFSTPIEELDESPLDEQISDQSNILDTAFPPLPPVLPAFPHKTVRIVAGASSSKAATEPIAPLNATRRGKGRAPRLSTKSTTPCRAIPDGSVTPMTSPTKEFSNNLATTRVTGDPPSATPKAAKQVNRSRTLTDASIDSLIPYQFVMRSATWPGGLHPHLWRRVIVQTAIDGGVLSPAQVDNVLAYGEERGTLRIEMEAMGKKESVQLWGILDRMGCLEYEMEL